MDHKSFMEIIRQRSFISHDSKYQRSITVEYTIKSKIPELKNIFLTYYKFLPSLIIRDDKGSVIPLMSSRDTEFLFSGQIKKRTGEIKIELEEELKRIQENKEHLIWFSLKQNPMVLNELRTFTLVYIPESKVTEKPYMKIAIDKQSYPIYFSLFSPQNFNFSDQKYAYLKGTEIIKESKPPDFVKTFSGYQTLSLRITTKSNHAFILMYKLKAETSSKILTVFGGIVLSILPGILIGLSILNLKPSFVEIFDKNIEISLFIIGASLILPQLQSDDEVRKQLIVFYIIPIILGFVTLFV